AGIARFTGLAGAAELTAPAYWACGARGCTSGLANVTPELPLAMLDALRAGDFGQAMKVWEKARRFEELRAADASADNVSVVKEALAQLGLCRADVRPPSRPLPPFVKDELSGVLTGGCDKTTPALLMGAASANIPAIYVTAGPMLRGNYRGQPLGSGTDLWKFWDDARAGLIGECELAELESGIARSPGHCMTM